MAGLIITEALREEFHRSGRYTIVNRQDLQRAIEEMKLGQSGLLEEGKALQLGKWLAASQSISGRLSPLVASLSSRRVGQTSKRRDHGRGISPVPGGKRGRTAGRPAGTRPSALREIAITGVSCGSSLTGHPATAVSAASRPASKFFASGAQPPACLRGEAAGAPQGSRRAGGPGVPPQGHPPGRVNMRGDLPRLNSVKGDFFMSALLEMLGCRHPIIQGPIAALNEPKFVAAVSEAGAFGMLALASAIKKMQNASSRVSGPLRQSRSGRT